MTSPLISVTELRESLPYVTVLDVRYKTGGASGPGEYSLGHVPGAVYVDVETDLAALPAPMGDTPCRRPRRSRRRCAAPGSQDRPVVVYDDGDGGAARAWWLLRCHGHHDVRVLDGGWRLGRDGGEVERGVHHNAEPGDFSARPASCPSSRRTASST